MLDVYRRIKDLRLAAGLSQGELAKRTGYNDRSSIAKIEAGKVDLTQAKIVAFANALNTTPAYLMGWEGQERSAPTIPVGFEPPPKTTRRPLIGDIACGEPITAEQNIQDYVDVPDGIACDFCLRCHGDSMIDVGIRDNDIVYIRSQPKVEDGEIAAVRIGDEATLKRVYYDGNTITLVPANSAYRPKSYSGTELDNIQIEGLATGYTHWF